jgi:hypothetical protein
VSVTFKPTNSIYSFDRLADTNIIARLGPISFAGVQHADAIPTITLLMKFKRWRSNLRPNTAGPFGQFKTRHLRPFVVRYNQRRNAC